MLWIDGDVILSMYVLILSLVLGIIESRMSNAISNVKQTHGKYNSFGFRGELFGDDIYLRDVVCRYKLMANILLHQDLGESTK